MKSSLRKNLIAILTAVMAILMAMFIATNVNVARADGISIPSDADAPRVSGEYTDDFYMIDGASVRLETEGIKFTTIISKAYLQVLESQGTVEFFATAKKDGGTAMAVAFKDQPTSESMTGDTYELNTYLNFNNYTGDLAEACAVDFIVETYAKITPAQGEPKYERAYKPEGNDIARSMQAVANAHYLETGETEVENYFTVGSRSENKEGYFFSDNSGVITMAGLPEITDATDMKVYYGTKQLDATYKNGQVSFSAINVKEEDTTPYISVFTGGKVYSSKIEKATKITQSNVTDLLSLTGSETVYLAEDVDLTGITWDTTVAFTGTFDGGNHAVKNLTTVTGKGFFATAQGTIKNVAFVDAHTGGNSAVIADKPTGTLMLDNIFVSVIGKDNWSGATVYNNAGAQFAVNMNNVLVSFASSSTYYNLVGYMLRATSELKNIHVISGSGKYAREHDATAGYLKTGSTVTFHTDLATFATTKTTLTSFLDKCVKEYLEIVKISQSNVTDLLSLSGDETVYLAEDVDLAGITWNTTVVFTGIFDGGNHAVKNLTVEKTNGFFNKINGANIKNVAFVDVDLSKGNNGVITYRPSGSFTVENVFIEVITTNKEGRVGAICERSTSETTIITLTDVVISMPNNNNNEAICGYLIKGYSTWTNVHCIGLPNETASVGNVAGNGIKGTYTLHADLASFNSATKTLTTFLTSCVAKYLNANA